MGSLLDQLKSGIDVLANFFLGLARWLAGDEDYEIPNEATLFLKLVSLLLAVLVLWPAIVAVSRKTPSLLEKIVHLVSEIANQLLDALRNVIAERIPTAARHIVLPSSYSKLILWASATDREALAVSTANNSGVQRRLLAPYHGQFILGLVVLLLAIWSGIGLSFAAYMAVRGKVAVPPPVKEVGNLTATIQDLSVSSSEAVFIAFAGAFFCLMILALDRTIVSAIPNLSGIRNFVRAASLWCLRIIISLILASWIAETYSVILSRHLIESHLRQKIDQSIQVLQQERAVESESLAEYVRASAPACQSARTQLSEIPKRLSKESLACPKQHKTKGECKGPEYKKIKIEERELEAKVQKECDPSKVVIPESRKEKGDWLDAKIANLKADRAALAYDVSQGSDALQEIGNQRRDLRHPPGSDPALFDQFVTWSTFSPHKTFLVLLVIDLLPLIVKMIVKTSYTANLIQAEKFREAHMTLIPRFARPIVNRRKEAMDPLFPVIEGEFVERRTGLP